MALAIKTPHNEHPSHRLALPSGSMLAEYEIVRVLGQGGFGITYLCEDTRLKVQVAIKELLPLEFVTRGDDATVVLVTRSAQAGFSWAKQRFIEEAQTLIRLNHPHIVRAFRLLEQNGTAYLIMEYVQGLNVREWKLTHKNPVEDQIAGILLALMDALEHVHGAGLLHRDISPENILIRESGAPVLLDFGSARTIQQGESNYTSVVRHGFSPIEQYQFQGSQGCYTDIYSLAGVIAYVIGGEQPPRSIDRLSSPIKDQPLAAKFKDRYSQRLLRAVDCAFSVESHSRPQNIARWRSLLFKEPGYFLGKRFRHPFRNRLRSHALSFAAGLAIATLVFSFLWTSPVTKSSAVVNGSRFDNQADYLAKNSAEPASPPGLLRVTGSELGVTGLTLDTAEH